MTANRPAGPAAALDQYLRERRDVINKALSAILDDMVPAGRLRVAMAYCLEAGGKRLRPILCLAATEAVGGNPEVALHAGCAIELIHTYSLIHDDLPGVDNAPLRRGRPSCHAAFDEATAIFAGDALHTLAFQVLASAKHVPTGPETRLECIRIIAAATGNTGMIEGQMRDMLATEKPQTPEDLRRLQELKTGALITAAVHVGALLGGADAVTTGRLIAYAGQIGFAFQIADDLLDIEGDPSLMGKSTGEDARQKKATFPGLMGKEDARKLAHTLVEDSLAALASFGENADPLRKIAAFIIERGY
ncbi:MAG: polyprenyl synthetase family protein [Thermodesulfobacteriota bacterium]